ncbi:MAG TPA: hypothetical protein VEX87_22390 [Skermanella sp.]|nr:hypothetical protein [Skermanella sp.]
MASSNCSVPAPIQQLQVDVVLLEDAERLSQRHRRQADRRGVPGQHDLLRRPLQRLGMAVALGIVALGMVIAAGQHIGRESGEGGDDSSDTRRPEQATAGQGMRARPLG